MKFSQLGQLALASAVSAALVLGITACGQSNTIDFVYIASANANPGQSTALPRMASPARCRRFSAPPFPRAEIRSGWSPRRTADTSTH